MSTPSDPGHGSFVPPYQPGAGVPQVPPPPQLSPPRQQPPPRQEEPPSYRSVPGRRPRRQILLAVAIPLMAVSLLLGLLLGVLAGPPLLAERNGAELPSSQVSPGTGGSAGGDLEDGSVELLRRAETPADYFATVVW